MEGSDSSCYSTTEEGFSENSSIHTKPISYVMIRTGGTKMITIVVRC